MNLAVKISWGSRQAWLCSAVEAVQEACWEATLGHTGGDIKEKKRGGVGKKVRGVNHNMLCFELVYDLSYVTDIKINLYIKRKVMWVSRNLNQG